MAWIFIPYTIMEISYACMSMLFPVWDGIKEINASVLLGKVLLDPIGPYWYLHTFILCGTTYYFVHTYLSSTPFIRLLVTSSLLLLFSYIFHLLTFAKLSISWQALLSIWENVRSYLVSPLLFLPLSLWFFCAASRRNLNRGTLGGILITGWSSAFAVHLQTSPHTVKQASRSTERTHCLFFFSPPSLPHCPNSFCLSFRSTDRDMLSLYRHSHHSVR